MGQQINSKLSWVMWSLGALTFFTEYIIRVAPVSLMPDLIQAFNASPTQVSVFAAYFLYVYVFMQIPVGILIDRYGARLCLSLSTFICGISTLVFANTESLSMAQGMRMLFGFGASFALIATFKIALVFFRAQTFSVLVGATQALGMIGGAAGAVIVAKLALGYGWQMTLSTFGYVLLILATLSGILIRNTRKTSNTSHPVSSIHIKKVFKDRLTWIISIYLGFLFMPTAVIAELWGSVYLTTTKSITANQANECMSLIFFGFAMAGPFAGFLSNKIGKRSLMIISATFTTILLGLLLYYPLNTPSWLYFLSFAYGIANCGGIVTGYTTIGQLHSSEVSGLALGLANGMSVLIGAFCQQGLGIIIEQLQSTTPAKDHLSLLPSAGEFKTAMLIVVIGSLFSIMISLFIKGGYSKEPNKKSTHR